MHFPFNVYVLAMAGALLTTGLTLPLWRSWFQRLGLVDDPGHRKIHSQPIPLAGGLAVLAGLAMPLLGGALVLKLGLLGPGATEALTYGLGRRLPQLAAILIGAVGMTVLGWCDDRWELRASVKFAGQLLVASLVALAGIRITLFVDNLLFSYAVTILWILTVTNAFNFVDNMNGLCAGVGAIGVLHLLLTAAVHGQYLVAVLAAVTAGALLGFLPYNFPRATVFLGDAGSHLVGFLLAVLAILPHFYSQTNPNTLAVLSPLLILAVPLGDLVWVVLLRLRMGKPFYVGDTNHFSHQLVRLGLSRSSAVMVIWLAAALLGSLTLLF